MLSNHRGFPRSVFQPGLAGLIAACLLTFSPRLCVAPHSSMAPTSGNNALSSCQVKRIVWSALPERPEKLKTLRYGNWSEPKPAGRSGFGAFHRSIVLSGLCLATSMADDSQEFCDF